MIFLKRFCKPVIAIGLPAVLPSGTAAAAFRFAFQGGDQSPDSRGLDETFTLSLPGSVCKGLTPHDGNPARILRPDDVLGYRYAVML